MCGRILTVIWYGSLLAVYLWALIQALSLELTTAVGVVLAVWPFALVVSVWMERESVLSSIPIFRAHPMDGWGALSFPADWQVEGESVLVCREAEAILCAVVYRTAQWNAASTLCLPDNTPFTVKVRNSKPPESEAVLRCRYTVGGRKGIGYFCAVRKKDVYLVFVVCCGNYIGKYIAEHIWDEMRDEC